MPGTATVAHVRSGTAETERELDRISRTVHVDNVPLWACAHSVPSGTDSLMKLGLRGAWRLAHALPDLCACGLAKDVARICIDAAHRAVDWRGRDPGDRREIEIAVGLARLGVDGDLDPAMALEAFECAGLSTELIGFVSLITRKPKERGAIYEDFGYFAEALAAEAGPEARDVFDEMLLKVSRLIRGDELKIVSFVDGEERYAFQCAMVRP